MNRNALVLAILLLAGNTYAECVVKYDVAMYTNWNSAERIDRIQVLGTEDQYIDRLARDIGSGDAIMVKKGTPVRILEKIPDNGLLIEVKGVPLYGYRRYIDCR